MHREVISILPLFPLERNPVLGLLTHADSLLSEEAPSQPILNDSHNLPSH